MKKYPYIQLVLVIITIVLEIMPYSIRLTFRPSPDRTVEAQYSFFSQMSLGFTFWNFLAAVFTVGLFVLILCYAKWQKKALLYWICIISGLAVFLLSVGILLYGVSTYTILGYCIEGLLIFIFVSSILEKMRKKISA